MIKVCINVENFAKWLTEYLEREYHQDLHAFVSDTEIKRALIKYLQERRN